MSRVYINGRFLTQRISGVQRFAIEALHALDKIHSNSQTMGRIVVVAPKGTPRPHLQSIDFECVGPFQGHIWEQLTLPRVTSRDWLVSFGPTGPISKRNQLVTIHDAAVYTVPESYSSRFRAFYKAVLPRLVKRTPYVMTVSEFSKDELVVHLGAERKRVVVCGEGWEHVLSFSQERSVLEKNGLVSGKYFLAVSSVTPHKNFGVIARALQHLSEDVYPVAVVGALDDSVFGAIDQSSLSRLKMLGYVSDAELRSLYEGAAAFIHPSLYEGFGLPPLEAMALGCPVIVSQAGALPEVCGDAALYFNPNDERELARLMGQIVQDPDKRAWHVEQGKARIALHSWQLCAQKYASLIAALLERRS